MRLHLGCGTKKLEGWINIDSVPDCNPDVVHDLAEPLPYADLSADEIMAHGVLEHFDKYMRYLVVAQWSRVLKVGGSLDLELPDFKKLLWRFFFRKFTFNDFTDTLFGENLWESKIYIGHFGNHKWGYSQESLVDFLRPFGLEPQQVLTKGLNISYRGRKVRHVPQEEMDQWLIHSHNNKFGAASADVPLSQVRRKIKEFQEKSHEHK